MHTIKIKEASMNWVYLNLDSIAYFYYNEKADITTIKIKTGDLFAVNGNVSGKLAKLISTSTSGSTLTLE